jgi:hypothetical protein
MMGWLRRQRRGNGRAAQAARRDAQRRLDETRRRQPEVDRAHDRLARWVDQALGGRA